MCKTNYKSERAMGRSTLTHYYSTRTLRNATSILDGRSHYTSHKIDFWILIIILYIYIFQHSMSIVS